ncbi:MAG TPA: hypothetical protein PLL18_03425 [Flavobacteriales bacterium]|nr:hypothetical protein [Flavobacteriales bacterium]
MEATRLAETGGVKLARPGRTAMPLHASLPADVLMSREEQRPQ